MPYYMGDYYRGDYYRGDTPRRKPKRKRASSGGVRRAVASARRRGEHPFARKMRLARARAAGRRR